MPIINIESLSQEGVEIFSTLTEAQLRRSMECESGLFIAESPKVIQVALNSGYEPPVAAVYQPLKVRPVLTGV